MSDTNEPEDRVTPTTGMPIEQAPSGWAELPTEGVDDPEYAAAVRGEMGPESATRWEEIERLVKEAQQKMSRTPDGVEGELATGEEQALPAGYTAVDRVGVGLASDDGVAATMIAIVMEVELVGETDGVLVDRFVRIMPPFAALKLGRDIIDHVLSLAPADPEEAPPIPEPHDGAQDAPEKLDTEE